MKSLILAATAFAASNLMTAYADDPSSGERPDSTQTFHAAQCEGHYPHHLQGVCLGEDAIFWSFMTRLVKTTPDGEVLKTVPVVNHHGDLCFHDGRVWVAVNLGKFNDPQGNADSWVYVYNADDLTLADKHETSEVFHGAGGIGVRGNHFYVVGGLPDGIAENYIYEYDQKFQFVKKHVVSSGHTHLGIQTATFANGRWWFGCYGNPAILLVTDADFKILGRHEFNCSLGIAGLPNGQLLSASGQCHGETGCTGSVRRAIPNEKTGLQYIAPTPSTESN